MGEAFLGTFGALPAPVPPDAWVFPSSAGDLPSSSFLPHPPTMDQRPLGACTGFGYGSAFSSAVAIAMALEMGLTPPSVSAFIPSTMALYRRFRMASGFPAGADSGAFAEPCIKSMATYGVGSIALWPWDPPRFAEAPPPQYDHQALDHRVLNWYQALNVAALKSALAAKLPGVACFHVPPGFEETGKTGVWTDKGGAPIAGHCQAILGYDDARGAFLAQQHWGINWGIHHPVDAEMGFMWVPYSVFPGTRFTSCHVLTLVDTTAGG